MAPASRSAVRLLLASVARLLLTRVNSRGTQRLLLLACAYLLCCHLLPSLAELTPAGADVERVLRNAVRAQEARRRRQREQPSVHCSKGNPCTGMACPVGWITERKPQSPCECRCARVDAEEVIAGEENEREEERENER